MSSTCYFNRQYILLTFWVHSHLDLTQIYLYSPNIHIWNINIVCIIISCTFASHSSLPPSSELEVHLSSHKDISQTPVEVTHQWPPSSWSTDLLWVDVTSPGHLCVRMLCDHGVLGGVASPLVLHCVLILQSLEHGLSSPSLCNQQTCFELSVLQSRMLASVASQVCSLTVCTPPTGTASIGGWRGDGRGVLPTLTPAVLVLTIVPRTATVGFVSTDILL